MVTLARRRGRLLRPDMPPEIRHSVACANVQLLASKLLFDADFTAFMWALLSGSADALRKVTPPPPPRPRPPGGHWGAAEGAGGGRGVVPPGPQTNGAIAGPERHTGLWS